MQWTIPDSKFKGLASIKVWPESNELRCRISEPNPRFQIANFRFQTSDSELQIANFRFQISDSRFQAQETTALPSADHLLPATRSLLATTRCPLRAAFLPLRAACRPLSGARCLLATARCPLPAAIHLEGVEYGPRGALVHDSNRVLTVRQSLDSEHDHSGKPWKVLEVEVHITF